MSRWAVVLAGGTGSRFWPLSTPEMPKQLLPLVTEKPLLHDAVARLRPIVDPEHTIVLTNASLTKAIGKLLSELPRGNIIAEPQPAGTAAALTWAALSIERRDGRNAVMICVHADWAIADDKRFRETLLEAERVALKTESLVTVGIVPTRPDPGFGYIQPTDAATGKPSVVKRFVEKPDRARAEEMRNDGYLWNSGIFVWRVGDFLDEVDEHTPELAAALRHGRKGDAAQFFESVIMPVSVDVGILERSSKVMVVPGDFGWDDVGTWAALSRVRSKDEFGNVTTGDAHLLDCADNVVHADSGQVVMYGVNDLVVVTKKGLTMVTTIDKASDLKRLIESFAAADLEHA
ncbi:MAG TPA: sugar phosphate nucleotidyltransferase [Gemmatimonadaceae bacterium]|nr:sugar phosphate nucleotidyltransferase [Gemmatimonadaceae bacterium]